jgi:hypothetical protein
MIFLIYDPQPPNGGLRGNILSNYLIFFRESVLAPIRGLGVELKKKISLFFYLLATKTYLPEPTLTTTYFPSVPKTVISLLADKAIPLSVIS